MQHYIAIIWRSRHARTYGSGAALVTALQRAMQRWTCHLNSEQMAVYSLSNGAFCTHTYVLPKAAGVIFGQLFHAGHGARSMAPPDLSVAEISDTGPQWLNSNYWGRYVAFLRTNTQDSLQVIRDCSGQVPCYYAEHGDAYIFFSDIRDIAPLGLQFSINSDYLTAFIAQQPLHIRQTGLNEVKEVLAGDQVVITHAGVAHDALWNPRAIIESAPIEDYADGRDQLIQVTELVISAWASLSQRILLSLSGGLDSAIVLGCLKSLGHAERVVCVTQYTPNTSDDERCYARAAAQGAGVPLIELPRIDDGRLFVQAMHTIPPDPKPHLPKLLKALTVGTFNKVSEDTVCDTFWTGQGGDQIFLQVHNPYGAADYLYNHRFPIRIASLAYESAVLSRQSFWSVIAQAWQWRFRNSDGVGNGSKCGSGMRFLARPTTPDGSEDSFLSPWRGGNEHVPPGKQIQIDLLADLVNRHKPLMDLEHPYESHPLISQPLIELSLRLPSYSLLRGGRKRAMARDGFSDRVPSCITGREDKGETTDLCRSLLRGSVPLMREFLLDGTLVSKGILNRPVLERFILGQETFNTDETFPLFACIGAEMWARQWVNGIITAADA